MASASALDVYEAVRQCTGREDLARLGVAIFLHERGPRGYEAGYGLTDTGRIPEWEGIRNQIRGVCHDLNRFFGKEVKVNPATIRAFQRTEWRATDPEWWGKVWTWYARVSRAPTDQLAQMQVGRDEKRKTQNLSSLPKLPSVEDRLLGSLSPQIQERLKGNELSKEARRVLAIGIGIIGFAVLWNWIGGRK